MDFASASHPSFASFGFGFDGFNVFGRDWFAFGLKGSIDIQTVSGRLSRGVQYQKGVNRAYELPTNDARYDSLGSLLLNHCRGSHNL